jgi:hypothetical protein
MLSPSSSWSTLPTGFDLNNEQISRKSIHKSHIYEFYTVEGLLRLLTSRPVLEIWQALAENRDCRKKRVSLKTDLI